jgi:hypothetical protein
MKILGELIGLMFSVFFVGEIFMGSRAFAGAWMALIFATIFGFGFASYINDRVS